MEDVVDALIKELFQKQELYGKVSEIEIIDAVIERGLPLFYVTVVSEGLRQKATANSLLESSTSIGGKARTTLSKSSNKHLDYEKYEQKSVSIAGYIRKLPEGQKASAEKQLIAKSLGLCLNNNETYVEPFIRQGWKLRMV